MKCTLKVSGKVNSIILGQPPRAEVTMYNTTSDRECVYGHADHGTRHCHVCVCVCMDMLTTWDQTLSCVRVCVCVLTTWDQTLSCVCVLTTWDQTLPRVCVCMYGHADYMGTDTAVCVCMYGHADYMGPDTATCVWVCVYVWTC